MSDDLKREVLSLSGQPKREVLALPGQLVSAQESGIVEAYVSLFGVYVDSWVRTVIDRGAFKKTLSERGPNGTKQIRMLFSHDSWEVIGGPLEMAEHTKRQLPSTILERFPNADGGLYVKAKFNLDVRRARDEWALYRDGDKSEWSIGFNPIVEVFEDIDLPSGVTEKIRRLKEIRLWEFSTTAWGRDPATTTVSVQGVKIPGDNDAPEQENPPAESKVSSLTGWREKKLLHVRYKEIEHRLRRM